ncbi:uncharacterized protein DDB_G0290685 [Patella vulgata]|uniref:uncharacterized protein DDB_G0290685 n=1 Tax=Patella vulgata TaxID=6465 RepID=UPI00217F815C|nr:uncharacterized protein DDB_G0290685 [Patella vulgata]
MNSHKMNSQYYVHIHPGMARNIQIGNNKTMYINSSGECSTSPPTPPPPSAPRETYEERMQRLEENSRKRKEEAAAKKRLEEKQKRREELMREDHRFKDFGMSRIHWMHMMMNGRRGTENVDTVGDPVDADQETIEDTDAKKRREDRQKIRGEVERESHSLRDLDMSRIDWLRMMEERRGMKNVDTDRDPVHNDGGPVEKDRATDAKKRIEKRRREEVMRGSHPLRDVDMSRFDYLRMMDERRGMKNVDTYLGPGNDDGRPVETDRDTVDTDSKKRMEDRQKIRGEVERENHPLRDLDMSRIDWLRMMEERRGMKNVDTDRDPVHNDGGPVEKDRATDAKKRIEKRRREEVMRGSHPLRDVDMSRFDYLRMMDERRGMKNVDTYLGPGNDDGRPVETDRDTVDTDSKKRMEDRQKRRDFEYMMMMMMMNRHRGKETYTDSHGEDMRDKNKEDDSATNINRDIRNTDEKGMNEDGENMNTEMENVDREEVDIDRDSVDTGRDTDRDSMDTGRDTVDTDRGSLDTDQDTVDTDRDSVDTDQDNVGAIKENQEDKQSALGSVVSDVANDDERNREGEKKNINLEGKYSVVNEDDYRHDRANEDDCKYDQGNKDVNTFTMTNNSFDDNDFMHTYFTSINNFGRCSNIQIGNQNTMILSSTSNTPASGFSQKNRNAWKGTDEFTKARQDMAELKREESMKKRQGCDKIKLHIFGDAFTNSDRKGVYNNRWGAGTYRKEQNQDMECDDDDDDVDYEKNDTDHEMAYGAKYDERDRHFMKQGDSDKLDLILLSNKIWPGPGGEGCHVNVKRTISIQELEDVLKLKSFGVEVDHIYRERLGPIFRFAMDSNKPISDYFIQDGDQVILLETGACPL